MNISELERLVEMVNGANICELTLRHEGARVTIRKSAPPSAPISSEALTITQDRDEQEHDFLLDMTPEMTLEGTDLPEENIVIIKSPLVGTFRHAKRPVVLAALVTEGQVLGIIEAMKLPSEVVAPGAGKVVEVLSKKGNLSNTDKIFTLYSRKIRLEIEKEFAMSPLHRVCFLKSSKTFRKTVSGFSLVEMLVVIALIAILGGSLFSFYAGKGTGKKGEAKTPMAATYDSVCLQNLGSVRQCIKAEEATDDEKHPTALTAIKSLTPDLRACPVGKEPYAYDPATGEVHCVHPGHEKY